MRIEDFFREVSKAISSNSSNVWIVLLILFFIFICLVIYYFYFDPSIYSKNKNIKIQKHKIVSGGANSVLENIMSGDTSEEAVHLKSSTNSYVQKYIESPLDPGIINLLNSKYWELLAYIIKRKFSNGSCDILALDFTGNERNIIDFGYISSKLGDNIDNFSEKSFEEAFISEVEIDPKIKYYTITSWLLEQIKENSGLYIIQKLKADYERITSEISMANQEKEANKKVRENLLEEIKAMPGLSPQAYAEVTAISDKLKKIIDIYAFFKYKTQSGTQLSREEMLEMVNIENTLINNLRSERRDIFKGISGGDRAQYQLSKYETAIVQKECEILSLVSQKGQCKSEYDKALSHYNSISSEGHIQFMTEKVMFIKGVFIEIAKHNDLEPIVFMSRKIGKKLLEQIYNAIGRAGRIDIDIFNNKIARQKGIPSIMFTPGCGDGMYSAEINMFLIPEFPFKNHMESVLTALAFYKWACDDSGELKNSFQVIKQNRRLKPQALEQAFVRDYIIYITRETVGQKTLEKEIRDWFVLTIGPHRGDVPRISVRNIEKEIPKEETPVEEKIAETTAGETGEAEKAAPVQAENMAPAAAQQPAVSGEAAAQPGTAGETGATITAAAKETATEIKIEENGKAKTETAVKTTAPETKEPATAAQQPAVKIETAGAETAAAKTESAAAPQKIEPAVQPLNVEKDLYEKIKSDLGAGISGKLIFSGASNKAEKYNILINNVSPESAGKFFRLILENEELKKLFKEIAEK